MAAALALLAACSSSGGGGTPSTSAPQPSSSAPAASSGVPTATAAPASRTSSPSGSPSATSSGSGGVGLTHLRVADVTFVGSRGWLLGTADCLSGKGTGCTAIEHSTDGGRTWRSMRAPSGVHVAFPTDGGSSRADGACAKPCLSGIRYASATVGYLYGGGTDGALLFTTDGGSSWRPLPGHADGLEAADGSVLSVVDSGACPPGCSYSIEKSPTGTMESHRVTLPGRGNEGSGAELARSGRHAYLLSVGHVSGGGDTATSVLYTSSDDGSSWTNRGEPCPQRGGREFDGALLSAAPDGSVAVLCRGRTQPYGQFVTMSPAGGAHFTAAPSSALGSARVTALGAVTGSTVLVSSEETYRSTDGGAHFARLSANAGSSPGQVAWIGFASSSVGHAISTDRRTVWNTTDGGRSWTRAGLG